MEVLSIIAIILLVIVLGAIALAGISIAIAIAAAFWPTLLGFYAMISLWSGGNSNAGVISFIVGVIGNFYWKRLSNSWEWFREWNYGGTPLSKIRTSSRFSDTRTHKEILRDIERKIDDPYS